MNDTQDHGPEHMHLPFYPSDASDDGRTGPSRPVLYKDTDGQTEAGPSLATAAAVLRDYYVPGLQRQLGAQLAWMGPETMIRPGPSSRRTRMRRWAAWRRRVIGCWIAGVDPLADDR